MSPSEDLRLRAAADTLNAWARGEAPAQTPHPHLVVAESAEAVAWLLDPESAVLGPDTVVLAPGLRDTELPTGPGTWVPCSGGVSEAGDELAVGRDFFLLTTDYTSIEYLSVVGPTVARITSAEDAEALVADARQARQTGDLPKGLVHRAVELGDVAGLLGTPPAGLPWLHVDRDGDVRLSPFGAPLGRVGDTAAQLTAALTEMGTPAAALPAEALAVLEDADLTLVRSYVAAVTAVRTLLSTGRSDWRVSGMGHQLVDGFVPAPRSDLLILSGDDDHVLFAPAARRAFRLDRPHAELLELLLGSADEDAAVEQLRRRGHEGEQARELLSQSTAALASYGLSLAPAGTV